MVSHHFKLKLKVSLYIFISCQSNYRSVYPQHQSLNEFQQVQRSDKTDELMVLPLIQLHNFLRPPSTDCRVIRNAFKAPRNFMIFWHAVKCKVEEFSWINTTDNFKCLCGLRKWKRVKYSLQISPFDHESKIIDTLHRIFVKMWFIQYYRNG